MESRHNLTGIPYFNIDGLRATRALCSRKSSYDAPFLISVISAGMISQTAAGLRTWLFPL